MLDAESIRQALGLQPHPEEGGYFAETYRSGLVLPREHLPPDYSGPRSASTAIYYMLTPDTMSAMHRVASDEVFHFYLGDPVEQLLLYPDGRTETRFLGTDIGAGMRPQALVPAGVWQGARLINGGSVALLGATVSPGFDYADYEHGDRAKLVAAYPSERAMIEALTSAST